MRILFAFILLFAINKAFSQNLVPNPSFEDTTFCPLFFSQLYATPSWLNFGISPDYFNSCNQGGLNVPNASTGYQYAHSGNAMSGLFLKRKPSAPEGPNAREFIAVQLTTSLTVGMKYYFSCYINFSNWPLVGVACNKFGIKLSTVIFDSTQYSSLVNNFSHIYSDSIVTDTIQWYKISGSIVADSNYHYLILGNFFDDLNTNTINFGQLPDYSYYYIDDICFSADSLYCESWTSSILEISDSKTIIDIYPNPFQNKILVRSENLIASLEIYHLSGNISKKYLPTSSHFSIDLSDLCQGIYFIKIQTSTHILWDKILKLN